MLVGKLHLLYAFLDGMSIFAVFFAAGLEKRGMCVASKREPAKES